jgi:hypothetical protein
MERIVAAERTPRGKLFAAPVPRLAIVSRSSRVIDPPALDACGGYNQR